MFEWLHSQCSKADSPSSTSSSFAVEDLRTPPETLRIQGYLTLRSLFEGSTWPALLVAAYRRLQSAILTAIVGSNWEIRCGDAVCTRRCVRPKAAVVLRSSQQLAGKHNPNANS